MDTSKKYGLFAGPDYYPKGGVGDFKSFGESVEKLQALFSEGREKDEDKYEWGDIVDMETMTTICSNGVRWNGVTKRSERLWRDA